MECDGHQDHKETNSKEQDDNFLEELSQKYNA